MGTTNEPETNQIDQAISEPHKVPVWAFWRARRYVLTLWIFLGCVNAYSLRVNLSVTIVAMTQPRNFTLSNGTVYLERYFDWDTKIQGYLLSSFFYGYVFTQMIGGYLAVKFGGKPVFGVAIGVASLITVLSPFMAKIHVYLFLAGRVAVGIFEGMTTPSIQNLFTRWYPPLEKGKLVTICLSGSYIGTVISLPLSSFLATTLDWESVFYISGAAGCIWTVFWLKIARNNPSEDPHISEKELTYITESLKVTKINKPSLRVPWRSILSSKPVWAASAGVTCEIWGYYTLLTQLPKFMKYCLQYELDSVGIMSALPYIAVAILLQLSGQLADYFNSKQYLTLTLLRKSFVAVGFMGQCLFLVLSVHWMSKFGTVFCLIVAVGFGGIAMSAFCVNVIDLAPNYAPVITAMANTFATFPGIISPILTGYLVTDERNVEQWRIVFYITAGIYLLGSVIFLCCGSGELQSWDSEQWVKTKKLTSEEGCKNNAFESDEK
ncbi:unnamed protein product [Phyllotreta striolata]|uniref:Sialin n=1 Tax=Phyllotreta striolata TaxID=444603 RepID=A0A9N9TZ78_PHYSR|nr:unnamed protein product [Phyllotreta striolata]